MSPLVHGDLRVVPDVLRYRTRHWCFAVLRSWLNFVLPGGDRSGLALERLEVVEHPRQGSPRCASS
jgi:hypothetical protein